MCAVFYDLCYFSVCLEMSSSCGSALKVEVGTAPQPPPPQAELAFSVANILKNHPAAASLTPSPCSGGSPLLKRSLFGEERPEHGGKKTKRMIIEDVIIRGSHNKGKGSTAITPLR